MIARPALPPGRATQRGVHGAAVAIALALSVPNCASRGPARVANPNHPSVEPGVLRLALNVYDRSRPFSLAESPMSLALALDRDSPRTSPTDAVENGRTTLDRALDPRRADCTITYTTDAVYFTREGGNARVEFSSSITSLRHGSLLASVRCSDGKRVEVLLAKPAAGLADAHNHPFASVGFDGQIVFGRTWCSLATDAVDCGDHARSATIADLMPHGRHGPSPAAGYPTFRDWPRHDSWTHMMSHPAMLRRAVAGGLRLLVAHAVNNYAGCISALNFDRGQTARCADDMRAVREQVRAAYWTESFVDAQCGHPGCGWFRIVTSPADARRVMSDGKLAVVLGIEVDNPIDCDRNNAGCTPDAIRQRLDDAYACGIRHMFPIHFRTNAFGGGALSNPIAGPMADAVPCTEPRYTYGGQRNLGDYGRLPWIPDAIMESAASCNRYGLFERGRTMIHELMYRAMIVDVDHMSDRSFWDTLQVLDDSRTRVHAGWDTFAYPAMSSHLGMLDEAAGEDKLHESNGTAQELHRIWSVGGMTNVIGRPAERAADLRELSTTDPLYDSGPAQSAHGFAQHFRYAASRMPSGVGIGTDMNGGILQVGPRCSPPARACISSGSFVQSARSPNGNPQQWGSATTPPSPRWGLEHPPLGPHTLCGMRTSDVPPNPAWGEDAGCPRATAQTHVFDFGVDGMAHVGMIPDLAHDLSVQGLSDPIVDVFLRSAEEYVALWERAEMASRRLGVPLSARALATCPWDIHSTPQCPSDRSTQGP